MKVTFWGTRGSLPTPLTGEFVHQKIVGALRGAAGVDLNDDKKIEDYVNNLPFPVRHTFGGNSPCVQISEGNDFLLLDSGTGIQAFNLDARKRKKLRPPVTIHILMTHTHWDHIMGFPFFSPAFNPDNTILVYGVHPGLRERFETQMDLLHYPITMEDMHADIQFIEWEIGEKARIGSFEISNIAQTHPGDSYSYKIRSGDRVVVYATDAEYKDPRSDEINRYVDFYRGADLLIFDAMYTLEEAIEKEDFGHSNPIIGVDLAIAAGVKTLALFHHNMECNDEEIYLSYTKALTYAEYHSQIEENKDLTIISAYDNLVLDI